MPKNQKVTLTIIDHVNCHFDGLTEGQIQHIIDKTGIVNPKLYHTVGYQLGHIDAKESYFDAEGFSFLFSADEVINIIEKDFKVYDMDIIDERPETNIPEITIDENFLLEETGRTLREHQINVVNTALREHKGIFDASTSAGKAQPLWSSVLTPDGWKKMGDLKVGDYVIGSDGNPKEVVGVYPQGEKDVYQVKTQQGRIAHTCGEHLWAVRTKSDASLKRPYKIKTLFEIKDELTYKSGEYKWQLPIVSPTRTNKIFSGDIHPYVLGIILGDGHFGDYVYLMNTEKDIIDEVKRLLHKDDKLIEMPKTHHYCIRSRKSGKPSRTIMELRRMGLDRCRSWEKVVPPDYMLLDANDRLELLRGLIDTDGYVERSASIEFTSSSESLADWVLDATRSLGGRASKTVKSFPTYTYKGEKRVGRPSYRISLRFSNEVVPCKSEKHLSKYKVGWKKVNDTIIDVAYYGKEECQCIAIDSADKLYVTDDYILTHNTLISLAFSKALDPYIKTVVCVPSEQLLNQTHEDYKKSDLKVGKLNASVKPAKREQFIKDNNHIIVTNKLFVNCKEYFSDGEWAIIQDETHVFGEVTAEVYRFDIPHYPIRIGLTGSFPFKDKLKSRMIKNHIGGDVIGNVEPKELSDKGYISKVDINVVKTVDKEIEELFEEMQEQKPSTYDWSVEQKYLLTNRNRVSTIAEYLKTLPDTNTLVLCHAEFGNLLSEYMGLPFIDKDTDVNTRQDHFNKFNDNDNHLQLASFGTSATGISVDDIFIVVMIDVGKNRTSILQGIGRGMRKSTKQDHVDIIDIYANLKYSKKHKTERFKIYKEKHYPYKEDKFDIIVKGE